MFHHHTNDGVRRGILQCTRPVGSTANVAYNIALERQDKKLTRTVPHHATLASLAILLKAECLHKTDMQLLWHVGCSCCLGSTTCLLRRYKDIAKICLPLFMWLSHAQQGSQAPLGYFDQLVEGPCPISTSCPPGGPLGAGMCLAGD
jgi:hypothetical protein